MTTTNQHDPNCGCRACTDPDPSLDDAVELLLRGLRDAVDVAERLPPELLPPHAQRLVAGARAALDEYDAATDDVSAGGNPIRLHPEDA